MTDDVRMTKNFMKSEFACPCCGENGIESRFVDKLQAIRDMVGQPLAISSGFRCASHNKKVGGVDGSAHTAGLACDIRCLSGGLRFEIIESAIIVGITRVGVSESFVHLDLDGSKPQKVVWTY